MPDQAPITPVAGFSDTQAILTNPLSRERESTPRRIKVIGPPSFSVLGVLRSLRALLQYSDLLYVLSSFRLKVRYKQSVLGWAWAVLQPLSLMGIYTFVFAHVTKVNTAGTPYSIFVLSGLLPWLFFSSSIANAVQGMVAHPGLLTKMYFPREIIPLSYLAAGLADFLIASVILAAMLAYYRVAPTWNVLYALPILVILGAFAASIALFFSALQVRFRDVGLALPFLLQVWMFATPVVYSMGAVPARFRNLYMLDPAALTIDAFRTAVIYGRAPEFHSMEIAVGVVLTGLILSYTFFKSSEGAMADVI
jgi:lipopolysaccharide transport system permease protein